MGHVGVAHSSSPSSTSTTTTIGMKVSMRIVHIWCGLLLLLRMHMMMMIVLLWTKSAVTGPTVNRTVNNGCALVCYTMRWALLLLLLLLMISIVHGLWRPWRVLRTTPILLLLLSPLLIGNVGGIGVITHGAGVTRGLMR
jgi:hypothetical protein